MYVIIFFSSMLFGVSVPSSLEKLDCAYISCPHAPSARPFFVERIIALFSVYSVGCFATATASNRKVCHVSL